MIRIYERTVISRFTFSSIAADTTGGGEMDLVGSGQAFHSGVLKGVSVSCDSTDFDVSIRTHSNALPNTPSEIYRVTNISKYRNDANLGVGWANRDATAKGSLYLILVNQDIVRATGTITIELHSDIPKRFSKNTG